MEEIIEKSETVDEANGDISAGKELEAPTCEKTNAVQHENESQKPYHVRKEQVACLQHPSGHPLGFVQMERIIHEQVSRHHK